MNGAKKRVLLLNAGHNDERLLRALKKLGCYVITTGNRPELPGHLMADEYIYGDYTDKTPCSPWQKKNTWTRYVRAATTSA